MNLKVAISSIILFLFLGCGTVQVEQEDNKSLSSVLGVSTAIENGYDTPIENTEEENNEENQGRDINISTPPTEEPLVVTNIDEVNISNEINDSISMVAQEIPPTVEDRPIDEAEPTPIEETPPPVVEEEPKDYIAKFINEDNCSQILDKEFLVICYDYNLKVARSVAYTLEGDLVNELNIQERPSFYQEELIDEPYRAKSSDYTGSGYDRGHMAPDAAFDWSQESLEATYSLANIIPQVPEVNRYMWVDVEAYARDKAVELGELGVINVVSYDSNNSKYIGEDNISVSVGYYKILFNEDESYEECFYYANDINSTADGDTLLKHKVDCSNIDIR